MEFIRPFTTVNSNSTAKLIRIAEVALGLKSSVLLSRLDVVKAELHASPGVDAGSSNRVSVIELAATSTGGTAVTYRFNPADASADRDSVVSPISLKRQLVSLIQTNGSAWYSVPESVTGSGADAWAGQVISTSVNPNSGDETTSGSGKPNSIVLIVIASVFGALVIAILILRHQASTQARNHALERFAAR